MRGVAIVAVGLAVLVLPMTMGQGVEGKPTSLHLPPALDNIFLQDGFILEPIKLTVIQHTSRTITIPVI